MTMFSMRPFRSAQGNTRGDEMSCTFGATCFSRDGYCRALRRAFPTATAANLAAITGQSLRAAQMQVAGEADPSAEALAACIAALGPQFLAEAIPSAAWATAPARDAEIDRAVDIIRRAVTAKAPRAA